MPSSSEDPPTTLVVNPVSGSGDHLDRIRRRAQLAGYEVTTTEDDLDGKTLARAAVEDGATVIGAVGGDGTLNEVVRGVDAADALDTVTVGVVPVGTGNNFAQAIGVTDVDQAFDVLENGERRRIDLGVADESLFVNSCISGVTADASGETTPELKNRYGVLAYVITTFRTLSDFDGLGLSVDIWRPDQSEPVWAGDAVMALVGNGRRMSVRGNTQANMEDGLFDVTIIEHAPATDLVGEALVERLVGRETSQTVRRTASSLEISGLEGEPISFSLDGEIVERESLTLHVRDRALSIAVGESYDPSPVHDS